ncbi:hypothetical protein MPLB_1280030 [Mesorhizobium sp. ORS 3324]|nr:hypothetical protein MPLB_1280030 [Mesorhizobium sp. ORS 3324]
MRSDKRGVLALSGARGRPHRADGARKRPRLACRQELMVRTHRHKFLLGRHRDRQPGAFARLQSFPEAADRCRHRLVRGDRRPPLNSTPKGASAFRRRAGAQGRPRREVSLESTLCGRRRPSRPGGPDQAGRGAEDGRYRHRCRGAAVDAGALRLRRRDIGRLRSPDPNRGGGVSAAFPAAADRRRGGRLDHLYVGKAACCRKGNFAQIISPSHLSYNLSYKVNCPAFIGANSIFKGLFRKLSDVNPPKMLRC